MKLYIAEKPSLGRAIANVLPKPHQKEDGYIRTANGDCVSWCIGHLLEQAMPERYNPEYKQWKLQHLPITPEQWILEPKPRTQKQLKVLKRLIKQAEHIVHAGDPDREGQLLVDELIHYLSVPESKKHRIERCLISDLNPEAVRHAVANLRNNQEFVPLSVSALARSRADWLYGLNMTRLCSIQGQKAGYKGVLSVGRVQTPLLGLVVRRDAEIDRFQPHPYFEVWAHLEDEQKESFKAKWQPSEACSPYQDEEGRVLSQKLADTVVKRIKAQPARVEKVVQKQKKQTPPLPFNLSSLQIECAIKLGYKAQQVLDICQSLYEKHKLITYPRSDCRYLPRAHHGQGAVIAECIAHNITSLSDLVNKANFSIRHKAWNDKKVTAHHGIIPTQKRKSLGSLSNEEGHVYRLVCLQYIAQFYPHWVFKDTEIHLRISGGLFLARARETEQLGWKVVLGRQDKLPSSQYQKSPPELDKNKQNPTIRDEEDERQAKLPPLTEGQVLLCTHGERVDKETKAPPRFTEASLLRAMTGIARFVKDAAIKKVLKETDGLGTEATRASIIELLFKRHFLERRGKQILATEAGKKLIAALPDSATSPDMTAHWESQLEAMSHSKTSYQSFMRTICQSLPTLMASVEARSFAGLASANGKHTGFGSDQNKGNRSTQKAFKKRRRKKTTKDTA